MTGFFADSVWLSLVFGDALCNVSSTSVPGPLVRHLRTVNLLDDIEPDRSSQNCWQGQRAGSL